MTARDVVAFLDRYRRALRPPVPTRRHRRAVARTDDGFEVRDRRRAVAVRRRGRGERRRRASHACPRSPPRCRAASSSSRRSSTGARAAAGDGGVLVVGASASGVQIADELRRAGREVTIAVGEHVRLPRSLPRARHLLVAGSDRSARRALRRGRRHRRAPAGTPRCSSSATTSDRDLDLNALRDGGVQRRRPADGARRHDRAVLGRRSPNLVEERRPQAGSSAAPHRRVRRANTGSHDDVGPPTDRCRPASATRRPSSTCRRSRR